MANGSVSVRISRELLSVLQREHSEYLKKAKPISFIEFTRLKSHNGNGHAQQQRYPLW
jgi:hypothetical protein